MSERAFISQVDCPSLSLNHRNRSPPSREEREKRAHGRMASSHPLACDPVRGEERVTSWGLPRDGAGDQVCGPSDKEERLAFPSALASGHMESLSREQTDWFVTEETGFSHCQIRSLLLKPKPKEKPFPSACVQTGNHSFLQPQRFISNLPPSVPTCTSSSFPLPTPTDSVKGQQGGEKNSFKFYLLSTRTYPDTPPPLSQKPSKMLNLF